MSNILIFLQVLALFESSKQHKLFACFANNIFNLYKYMYILFSLNYYGQPTTVHRDSCCVPKTLLTTQKRKSMLVNHQSDYTFEHIIKDIQSNGFCFWENQWSAASHSCSM